MEPQFTPNLQSPDFREALNRAYEAAALEETPAETPVAEVPVELGTDVTPVVASDQTLPVEPVEPTEVVVETPTVETTPESEEQLREQIATLEARLAEKDTFIGRQSGEVGELRQAIDALTQKVDAAPPQTIQVGPHYVITQDMIDNDPGGTLAIAIKQNDERSAHLAYEAWKMEDPVNAALWVANKQAEAREAQFQAKIEEQNAKIEALSVPAQESAVQKSWSDSFALVSKEHPEFIQNAERLLSDVAPQYPHLVATLATGDANAKAEVLKALYVIDRSANPAAKQELEQAAAAASAEEAATRLAAAGVVGQTTTAGAQRELSYDEEEQARYAARISGGVSLEKGWTGRKVTT